MSDTVTIEGMETLVHVLEKIPEETERALTDAAGRIGIMVADTAKNMVNNRTGRLANSIRSSDPEVAEDGVITVTIGTNVEYAPYVEFGTGWRGAQSEYNYLYPVEGLTFTSKKHWGRWQDEKGEWHVGGPMPAQAPLRRALAANKIVASDLVYQAIKEIL
ncbi:MAG: HK97 gp10 family phage protein [Candidatus Methanomethylophilaceae archaeon]|nr:HK97 gp10 family phage protein [Candidatus Methanomethylophilaceae archaeon]